jgi:hypothetical protein
MNENEENKSVTAVAATDPSIVAVEIENDYPQSVGEA